MKLTDALLGEHGAFYALFEQVEEMASMQGPMAQIQGALTVLEAMIESHASLEDELLFSALEPQLGSQSGPLTVMRAEHDEMKRMFWQIEEAQDLEQATNLVAEALRAARSHFRKEEEVLFPMALRILGDDTVTQLGQTWARSRGVVIE